MKSSMFVARILLFSAQFLSAEPLHQQHEAFAVTCMKHTIPAKFWPKTETVICDWPGIICHLGVPWKLHYEWKYIQSVSSLDWLPPTLRKVNFWLSMSGRPYMFMNTVRLPQNMTFCYMQSCNIHGEVNLQTLPRRLEHFSLPNNRISGTVVLSNLPPNIRTIGLSGNSITTYVMDDSNLPPSLTKLFTTSFKVEITVKEVHLNKNPKSRKTMNFWDSYWTWYTINDEFESSW